jgi:potassium/chloride transporter 9
MGVIGAAKLLQAMARDALLPGLSIFGQGTKKSDEPVNAILFTFVVAQLTMLFDINRLASFITMTYLMTFLSTNLACFLLKIGSAPNFRPSFHYFNSWTALAGTVISGATMFFVDGIYASACVCILVILFVLIHYTTPPKTWGDVSQSLIYHQVRKYLLRLRPEHVKFWRPQILLFVNDFDTQYKMIQFCNSLKKGALFLLGHVIVSQDFAGTVPEVRRQQAAWAKFIEYARVKAFINISVSPSAEWGVRNMVLISGLGGMRPNIVVIDQFRRNHSMDVPQRSFLRRSFKGVGQSLDNCGSGEDNGSKKRQGSSNEESGMSVQSYLTILEELLFKLRINVAVAKGFEELELPAPAGRNTKRYIDLWPIQMSAELVADGTRSKQNLLTTNFDTYTLILQLGCILNTVPSWKLSYRLRVAVFVEYETDVQEEHGRVQTLLEKLRIEAEILVFWLASGDLKSYRIIVNGEESDVDQMAVNHVESLLKYDSWWQGIRKFRDGCRAKGKVGQATKLPGAAPAPAGDSFPHERHGVAKKRFDGLKKIIESSKRRKSIGGFGGMSVSLGMQTHHLLDSMVQYQTDVSEELTSGDESDTETFFSESEDDAPGSGGKRMSWESGSGETSAAKTSEGSVDDRKDGGRTSPHRLRHPRRSGVFYGASQAAPAASETAVADDSGPSDSDSPGRVLGPLITTTDEDGRTGGRPRERPTLLRSASSKRFSSAPIPETKVAAEEGSGPSIMFAPTVFAEGSLPQQSIYSRPAAAGRPSPSATGDAPASGFPSQASIPLSFNDLPCRAQHLILNELMIAHSQKTAVIFTTLPSPIEGTWREEAASETYVSDMEVLCDGLPPCLLVHSNSVTVTMNI